MLIDSKGWSTVKLDRNGIRFFYEQILGQSMPWPDMIRPAKVQALPDVLTVDEIAHIIHCTRPRRFRVFWLATYSLGLRLGETLKREIADIDSARVRVHVRLGKGNKDRFGALGATVMACDHCTHREVRLRSCGHRGCPRCQQHAATDWLERQRAKLLPVDYFLVTFTLPAALRRLTYRHSRDIHDLLFQIAIDTLRTFGRRHPELEADLAATAVLHTHTRKLDYHPHLHVIVPGAGIDQKNRWRTLKGRYLFNGKALARVFRARVIHGLKQAGFELPERCPSRWVVQCQHVGYGLPALKYLSRYLYRGVVAERQIVAFDPHARTVTFRYVRTRRTGGCAG